jgi:hypothetical protein
MCVVNATHDIIPKILYEKSDPNHKYH